MWTERDQQRFENDDDGSPLPGTIAYNLLHGFPAHFQPPTPKPSMTSANVIIYIIRKGKTKVGQHRFNKMCKPYWEHLERFTPYSEHTIQATGYDEGEEPWENDIEPLSRFMAKVGRIEA